MSRANNSFKVVLLGEGCVGKTSLVLRYIEDKFNPQHMTTVQASFVTKKLTLNDGQRAQLNIWDTAGQERFHALGPIYYRGSHGAILVYDITDLDSFQKVKIWVKELKRMLGNKIIITIVGNKIDLEAERNVNYDDAIKYAQNVGAHYYETSAKLNEGVSELFENLTELMTKRRQATTQEQEAGALRSDDNILRIPSINSIDVDNDDDDIDCQDNGPGRTTQRSCCGTG